MRNPQTPIQELLSIPRLTLSDDLPQSTIDRCVALFDEIGGDVSSTDAEAMVELLSRSDDDMLGANWSLLHAIEASPSWPDWDVLDRYEGWWIDTLRSRCCNAGLRRTTRLGKLFRRWI